MVDCLVRRPVAWTVDLNASPEELHAQAVALQVGGCVNHAPLPLLPQLCCNEGSHSSVQNGVQIGRRGQATPDLNMRFLLGISQHSHLLTEVLMAAGVSCLGTLAMLRRDICKILNNDGTWKAGCLALALQAQLYVPTSYALGWKRLFWDQLWPARQKWTSSGGLASDFQVRVGVRFRPSSTDAASTGYGELFLPLHQRLRLWRAGKLSREDLLDAGSQAGLVDALSSQGELPPHVVEALLDAQHLKVHAAESHAQAALVARGQDHLGPLNYQAPQREAGATADGDGTDVGHFPSTLTSGLSASSEEEIAPESDVSKPIEIPDQVTSDAPRQRRGGSARVLGVQPSRVMMYVPGQGARNFAYGRVLGEAQPQETVYAELGHDMVCAMLNGFNACLFCYGQTGSGKTHTLFGPEGCIAQTHQQDVALPPEAGIVARALHEVLEQSKNIQRSQGLSVSITCQYVEIYNEQVSDLLAGGDVQIRGPQATLQGASEVPVTSFSEALQLVQHGQMRKHVAETAMNERSSRAHTVFALNLTQVNQRLNATARSTLHLVDLAGCEQLKTSKATGERQAETIGINSSLFVLGKVITALVEGHRHVPYLESALTRLLRPALGGNSRTTVCVTCSPEDLHGEQTLHALRFGERCQRIVNRAALEEVRSVDDALRAIDAALQACQKALSQQKGRGLEHLSSHQRLREKYLQLQQTRCSLTGRV